MIKAKKSTEGKKTTEEKIQSCLTRLQKLVIQYYKENPETTDSLEENKDTIMFYSSSVTGIGYDECSDCFYSIANINLHGKNGDYKEIRSPIDYKKVRR